MRFYERLSFRLMSSVAVVSLLTAAGIFTFETHMQRERAEQVLREKADAVAKQFLAVRSYMAQTEKTVSDTAPSNYRHLDPVAVSRVAGEIFGENAGATVREVWVEAHNPAHRPDALEATLFTAFAQPGAGENAAWQVVSSPQGRVFRYVKPIQLEESCLGCHTGKSAQVGKFMGAVSISVPTASFESDLARQTRSRLLGTLVVIVAFLTVLGVLLRRLVTSPVSELTGHALRLAGGDFSPQPVLPQARGEMAVLAHTFEHMSGALRDLYANLESKVVERTQQLLAANQELERQRAALEQQSRELEKANRLKSEFLASVSHELRTPLTSLMAFTELLRDGSAGPLTPIQAEYLSDMQESGERLYAHINDLLDLAKIEAGRMVLHMETIPISEVIDRVARRMQPLALRKNLTLQVACIDRMQLVRADPPKLEQVLLNLVSNAIKFTDSGTVEIGCDAPQHQQVTVWVRDTGIGIEADHYELIFEKFRQIDGSSTRTHKGTGLGLALAKHLVEMHGGRIWVESTPEVGSTFFFTLPASTQAVDLGEPGEPGEMKDGLGPGDYVA